MCNVCFWIDNNNTRLNLINIYGTDDNDDKILLNLCYVNKNYYIVLYEPDWLYNINCTVKWSDISYLKNIIEIKYFYLKFHIYQDIWNRIK